MSLTTNDIISAIGKAGIKITITADKKNLELTGPTHLLPPDMLKGIRARKGELIANRLRFAEILEVIRAAHNASDKKFSGRILWDKDSELSRAAGEALDQAMYNYVDGSASMSEVQEAWSVYIKSLIDQAPTQTGKKVII